MTLPVVAGVGDDGDGPEQRDQRQQLLEAPPGHVAHGGVARPGGEIHERRMEGDGQRVFAQCLRNGAEVGLRKTFERPGVEDDLGVEAVAGEMINAAVPEPGE